MNAVPDESSLDVLVDSTAVSNNLAYGTSTGYQSTQSGSHQVTIEPSGSSTALLQQSITFASGADTTVIFYNFSQSAAGMVLADNNSAPASGDFKIRIVNASPNLGPADVYIVTPGTDLNTVESHGEQSGLWLGRRLPVSRCGKLRGCAHRRSARS